MLCSLISIIPSSVYFDNSNGVEQCTLNETESTRCDIILVIISALFSFF